MCHQNSQLFNLQLISLYSVLPAVWAPQTFRLLLQNLVTTGYITGELWLQGQLAHANILKPSIGCPGKCLFMCFMWGMSVTSSSSIPSISCTPVDELMSHTVSHGGSHRPIRIRVLYSTPYRVVKPCSLAMCELLYPGTTQSHLGTTQSYFWDHAAKFGTTQ